MDVCAPATVAIWEAEPAIRRAQAKLGPSDGLALEEMVGVGIGVCVGIGVAVGEGLAVGLGVGVGVGVGAGEGVGVGEGVGEGVASVSTKDQIVLQSLQLPDESLALTLQFQMPKDNTGV